jgi:hypothetical protein
VLVFNESEYTNPFDYVDWRWRRAVALCDAGARPERNIDDKYIWRAFRFLSDLRGIKSPIETYSVTMRHRGTAESFDWFNNKTKKSQFLEALILCEDQDPLDICSYMNITPKTLEMYEKLFFDIRENIGDKGYLTTKILHPAIAAELRDMVHPVYAWKLIALFGGAPVLKSCWEYRDHGDETNRFHYRAGFSQMMKNFGMANFFRPVNKYTAGEVTDNVMRMVEIESKRAALEGNDPDVISSRADAIQGILSSVQFYMPDPDDKIDGCVEPRLFDLTTQKRLPIDTEVTVAVE